MNELERILKLLFNSGQALLSFCVVGCDHYYLLLPYMNNEKHQNDWF